MRRTILPAVITAVSLLAAAAGPAGAADPNCFGSWATILVAPGVPAIGTPGDDVILGTSGNDIIRGRGGDDRICAGAGDDRVRGGSGRDRIHGGAGGDTLDGGDHSDRLVGGSGNDTLMHSPGRDTLVGGDGSDTYNASSAEPRSGPNLYPRDGLQIGLASGEVSGHVVGSPTLDGIERVVGTNMDDKIGSGISATARLKGGAGDDDLSGFGNDVLLGNSGDDVLYSGGTGVTLSGGVGNDLCRIRPFNQAVSCEAIRQSCPAKGDPVPGDAGSVTTAQVDVDGNGVGLNADTLTVYRRNDKWFVHIAATSGCNSQTVLPTAHTDTARALGGFDVNADGIEEAFVVVGQAGVTETVAIIGFVDCTVAPVTLAGTGDLARFPIGRGSGISRGLECADDQLIKYRSEYLGGDFVDFYELTTARYDVDARWSQTAAEADRVSRTVLEVAYYLKKSGELSCGDLSL